MKVWLIEHLPTGRFMPARMSRTGRGGWSYWSPTPPLDLGTNEGPRIFFTKRAAVNSLTMWLQGVWKHEVHRSVSYLGEEDDYDELAPHTPNAPRKREEMAIVEMKLVERSK